MKRDFYGDGVGAVLEADGVGAALREGLGGAEAGYLIGEVACGGDAEVGFDGGHGLGEDVDAPGGLTGDVEFSIAAGGGACLLYTSPSPRDS